MEETLKELETFHRLAQVIFVSIDSKGKIRYINDYGSQLLGYCPGELINRDWFDTCVPKHSRTTLRTIYDKFLSDDAEPMGFYQNPVLRQDNTEITISWHNMPRRNASGEIIGAFSTGIDISALVEAGKMQQALGEMLENALNEIYIVDADSLRLLHINQSAEKNIGYTEIDWPTIGLKQLVPTSLRQAFISYLHKVSTEKRSEGIFETRFQRKDGSSYAVEIYLHRSLYRSLPALIVYAQDISTRKQAQSLLVASEAKYHTILNTAAEGILTINLREEIQSLNKAAENLFGYRADKVMGKNVRLLVSPQSHSAYESLIEQYLAKNSIELAPTSEELTAISKDGREIPLEMSVARVTFESTPLIILVTHDLSRRVQAEAALRIREEELQNLREHLYRSHRVSHMKALASGIAHEINQPLSAINTFAETCQKLISESKEVTEVIDHSLKQISEQAQRAGGIITTLRSMMKSSPHKKEDVDINKLVEYTIQLIKPELNQHHIAVHLHLGDERYTVRTDPMQIQQIILNLIQNCIDSLKQTKANGRKIDLFTEIVKDSDPTIQLIKCTIQDNGVGVSENQQQNLFTPFVTTKIEGLELDLSICRDIIHTHGGELNANFAHSPGCEFYFTLPISS